MNEKNRIVTFRDWKGEDIDFWEDADGDVGVMLKGDERSIVISRESVPGLAAWLTAIVSGMSTKELIESAISGAAKLCPPEPSAYVASRLGLRAFLSAVGEDGDEIPERLLGLALFARETIQEAVNAAKAVGHHTFITLG
jgi:hypothetical protein